MAKDHQLSSLIKWSHRDEWAELFDAVFDEHFGAALANYDIDFEKLEELVGEDRIARLWDCAFEDFLTQPQSPAEPGTVVDDYLKRRGWKESPSTRRYLEALRESVFSLYEVGDVVPGQSLVLRDLLRESDPVTVTEPSASRVLRKGERLGCRVVEVAGRHRLSSGHIVFGDSAVATVMEEIGGGLASMRAALEEERAGVSPDDVEPVDAAEIDADLLGGWAPEFTAIWLEDNLNGRLEKVPPPRFNSDGDELQFHTITYELTAGTTPDAIARLLDAAPDLRIEEDNVWNWVDAGGGHDDKRGVPALPVSEVRGDRLHLELEDGTPVLATIELFEDGLVLSANSKERADRAKVMMKSVLKGLIGQPHTHVEGSQGGEAGN